MMLGVHTVADGNGATPEVQTFSLVPQGGQFYLFLGNQSTAWLPFDATTVPVTNALNGFTNLAALGITGINVGLDAATRTYTVTFTSAGNVPTLGGFVQLNVP